MPRKILLEADNLRLSAGTGIATYARNLAGELRGMGHAVDALVSVRRPIDGKDAVLNEVSFYDAMAEKPLPFPLRLGLFFNQITGSPFGIKPTPVMRQQTIVDPSPGRFDAFDTVLTVPSLVDRSRFHFKRHGRSLKIKTENGPALFQATQAIPLTVAGVPNLYTIHDIVPLRLPYTTLDEKKYVLNMHRHLARSADHIVTVSEFSRRDIISLLGVPEHRITNTYQAVSLPRALVECSMDEVARDLENLFALEPKQYFLFVGAIEPKKNVSRMVDAFASSGSKRPLIIAGSSAWMAQADLKKINDKRFQHYVMKDGVMTSARRVRRVSYLPFEQLVTLIRGARALIFPSLYEGFGLPVLEAMLLGTPVITSNVSSLPEVAGDAALLVPPTDTAALSAAIRKLDNDVDLAADLSQRGLKRAAEFSPERYRERLAALYKNVLG